MDREISNEGRGKVIIKWVVFLLIGVGLLVAGNWAIKTFLSKKADRGELVIATVERGTIQNTLTASGVIVPSVEREINAPVPTEIKKVHLSIGKEVKKGDLIMELDREYTQLEYDQLKDELELRKNNIDKLKLKFDKDLRDLDYQDQIKALRVAQLAAEVQDQKRLLQIGGATAEELEKAKLNLQVEELEKKMLENELSYSRSVNSNEKKSLELEFQIQEKKLAELRRKLSETNVRTPQAGVITWINEDIGNTVAQGETIVRIADLGSYRVEATSSDRNTEKIKIGLPAKVRIGQSYFAGVVDRILPAVENNTVKFYIKLENQSSSALRPNMRTEVFLITDVKSDVLRIKNGRSLTRAISPEVFFVEGDLAIKKRINKGMMNAEYIEITGPVKEGDRIIISDTEEYEHLDKFNINGNK